MLSITHVQAQALCIELNEPFGIATGTQHRADNVLVRVELSDGSVGLGEAAPFPAVSGETQELALVTLSEHTEAFIGRPIRSWRRWCCEAAERMAGCPSAMCGLQSALLDAWLKCHRCSMWAFFGGSDNVLVSDITLPTGSVVAAEAGTRRAIELGFRQLKVKVGGSSIAHDSARLRAIAAVAPQAELLLDANGAFSADEALELLRETGEARRQLVLFEQPTAPGNLEAAARVRRESGLRVVADESARSCAELMSIASSGAADAINIKIMKSGLLEALDMVTLAKRLGLGLMVGGMVESKLAMSISACIAAGMGGFAWVDLDTPLFMKSVSVDGANLQGGFKRSDSSLLVDVIEEGHGVHIVTEAC